MIRLNNHTATELHYNGHVITKARYNGEVVFLAAPQAYSFRGEASDGTEIAFKINGANFTVQPIGGKFSYSYGEPVESLANFATSATTVTELSFDGDAFDTSGNTNMNSMFSYCTGLTSLDLSGMDTSNVTTMRFTFSHCSSMTDLNISGIDTSKVTDSTNTFLDCPSLANVNADGAKLSINIDLSGSPLTLESAISILSALQPSTGKTVKFSDATKSAIDESEEALSLIDAAIDSGWTVDGYERRRTEFTFRGTSTDAETVFLVNGEELTARTSDGKFSALVDGGINDLRMFRGSTVPSYGLTSLEFGAEGGAITPSRMTYMLHNNKSLESVTGLANIDASGCSSLSDAFSLCVALTELDGIGSWDTSSLKYAIETFAGCRSLTSLDLSGWRTDGVEDMKSMFSYCTGLTSLDISGWDLGSVDVDVMYEESGTDDMFAGCVSLSGLNMDGAKVLSPLNLSDCPLSLESAKSVLNALGSFPTYYGHLKVTFSESTVELIENDVEAMVIVRQKRDIGWRLNVKYDKITVSGTVTDTKNYGPALFMNVAKNASGSYKPQIGVNEFVYGTLDGKNWTADISAGHPFTSLACMFYNDNSVTARNRYLSSVKFEDSFDTSNVTSLEKMFYTNTLNTSELETVEGIEEFDTFMVESMSEMFRYCKKLKSIPDISGWRTEQCRDFSNMFQRCESLTELSLPSIGHPLSQTYTSGMFGSCTKLSVIRKAGDIYCGILLKDCPLTIESAKVILNALASPQSGSQTLNFSSSTSTLINSDEEALALVAEKADLGWTIALS